VKYFQQFLIWSCLSCALIDGEPAERKELGTIIKNGANFGKNIKKGEIVCLVFNDPSKNNIYLFINEKSCLVLTGNRESVSDLISGELELAEDIKSYLSNNLVTILSYCLFPTRSTVIDSKFIESSEATISYVDSERLNSYNKEIEAVKSEYLPKNNLIMDENKWHCTQYIGMDDGSIKKYSLNGSMKPFKIDDMKSDTVAKAGTFGCFSQL